MIEGTVDSEAMDTNVESTPESTDTSVQESSNIDVPAEENVYQPNFSYSVMDKQLEIPEQFRSIIKDQDTEKLVREIFEKAEGLNYVKPKYESVKSEYENLKNQFEPVQKDLSLLGDLLKNKDFGGFFQAFNLTDEDIVKYAIDRMEYFQLPPEKRQMMDAQRQQGLDYYRIKQENDFYKQQQSQAELNNTYNELKSSTTSPHVSPIVESFNARAGQPDAFEKAVIAHAQSHFAMYKQDLSVPQAIESFIKTFGLAGMASQSSTQNAGAQVGANLAERKATLPKPGSGSMSPVKERVKTLADLRKLQEKAYEHGHG
jgi:hypothetical protein